jgi:ankyrin repeat protein
MTPLMLAIASETQDLRVARLLLEKGSDVNATSKDGETVLDWARKFGDPAMLSLLEKAGAKGSASAPLPH